MCRDISTAIELCPDSWVDNIGRKANNKRIAGKLEPGDGTLAPQMTCEISQQSMLEHAMFVHNRHVDESADVAVRPCSDFPANKAVLGTHSVQESEVAVGICRSQFTPDRDLISQTGRRETVGMMSVAVDLGPWPMQRCLAAGTRTRTLEDGSQIEDCVEGWCALGFSPPFLAFFNDKVLPCWCGVVL